MSLFTSYLPALVQRRVSLALAAAGIFFVPPFALSLAALFWAPASVAWRLFSLGLFVSMAGTLLILAIWRMREAYLIQKIAPIHAHVKPLAASADESQDKILFLRQNFEEYKQEKVLLIQELESSKEALEQLTQELALCSKTAEAERERREREILQLLEQLSQQKDLLEEYQQQIVLQRQEIALAEQNAQDLENKLRDMSFELRDQKYELQTLLKLSATEEEETPTFRFKGEVTGNAETEALRTPGEALLLLKRCFEKARKIAAPTYYTPQHAPFGHVAATSHPLDLRRLCDSLRGEASAAIILFSPKEEKVLYASDPVQAVTGISSNSWKAEGHDLLQQHLPDWKSLIHRLPTHGELLYPVNFIGEDTLLHPCQLYLGSIPGGLFRNYVIGVFFAETPCTTS